MITEYLLMTDKSEHLGTFDSYTEAVRFATAYLEDMSNSTVDIFVSYSKVYTKVHVSLIQ